MANRPKQRDRNRRAQIEAMRREQQARERRKSLLFIVIAVVLGIGLVLAAALPSYLSSRNSPAKRTLGSYGVSPAAAACTKVLTVPDTNKPKFRKHEKEGTTIHYATVPPSFGDHWPSPVFPSQPFYTVKDRPRIEQLVHNLEHGYTILWYDDTIKGTALQDLQKLAETARNQSAVQPGDKFIVSAWDNAYGHFPKGKHLALAHWGASDSHRQLCGRLSGDVVANFIDSFKASDAPEAGAE